MGEPFTLPASQPALRAMKARFARFNLISEAEVETRVHRAMKTLAVLPDAEASWLVRMGDIPRALIDEPGDEAQDRPPRFRPTPFDISDYLTALAWVNPLPGPQQRLINYRAFDIPWKTIAERIGQSETTARHRYRAAISNCWCAASHAYEQAALAKNRQRKRA